MHRLRGKHLQGEMTRSWPEIIDVFQSAIGSASCTVCPANSQSPSGSSALTNCVCNSGYTSAPSLSSLFDFMRFSLQWSRWRSTCCNCCCCSLSSGACFRSLRCLRDWHVQNERGLRSLHGLSVAVVDCEHRQHRFDAMYLQHWFKRQRG